VETSPLKRVYFCWICGSAVDLQTCGTDEQGMAVHEDCYFLKIALANESMRLVVRKSAHRIRRVVTGNAGSRARRASAS